MFESMYARLQGIAEADNEHEDRLGTACPIKLDLFLAGGHELRDVCLVDGENSLDDKSIDVHLRDRRAAGADRTWSVAIEHIVMFCHVWPTEADELEALRLTGKA